MTFWATLYFAGQVVITMGVEGQTLATCETLTAMMLTDIAIGYANPDDSDVLALDWFPTNQFTASCETTRLNTDPKYME